MIKLLLLMAFNINSHTDILIKAHPGCENIPDVHYYQASGLMCLPSDLIFKGDFDGTVVMPDGGDDIEK